MMDAIAYKNGNKNQWRRAMWNTVERLVDNPREAIVLYLPGSTDLDRPEALRRNFRAANLIAVERDAGVAKALRKRGVTTINGTLTEVLAGWPADRRIGVVIADFQSGISRDVEEFAALYSTHPALNGCVSVVNLQRGRDPAAEKWKTMVWGDGWALDDASTYPNGLDEAALLRAKNADRNGAVSRALIFMRLQLFFLRDEWTRSTRHFKACADAALAEDARVRASYEGPLRGLLLRGLREAGQLIVDEFERSHRIVPLPPYRSSEKSPLFDSIVFLYRGLDRKAPATPVCREVVAALAIRTRRLRGELRARS